MVSTGSRLSSANTLLALLRLQSLAFGFGTFAYAKDQASLPHDGLLKDNPPPVRGTYPGLFNAGFASALESFMLIRLGWTTAWRNVSDVDGLRVLLTEDCTVCTSEDANGAERRRWTFRNMPLADQRKTREESFTKP
jgi:hypothetical protein